MSTNTTPAIDIYTYRDDFTSLERIRYIAAICDAAERGEPLEMGSVINWKRDGAKWTASEDGAKTVARCFWGGGYVYRVARPEIAEGHNPDGLTEAQVGIKDGWRLLTTEELYGQPCTEILGIEHTFGPNDDHWVPAHCTLVPDGFTYRTKNPPGHYLPKPAPTKKLVPWTMQSVPKGDAWIRKIGGGSGSWVKRVTAICDEYITLGNDCFPYSRVLAEYEYSIDGCLSWHPCGTLTEVSP